jgi:hypothetical protein
MRAGPKKFPGIFRLRQEATVVSQKADRKQIPPMDIPAKTAR